MVPDVQSFPDGVASIDFASGSYKIEVTDEGNPLLEEDEDDSEEAEDNEPDDEGDSQPENGEDPSA